VKIEIEMGQHYTDCITGFTGMATGLVSYLTGCDQVLIAPKVGEDGALKDSHWFDITRLDGTLGKPDADAGGPQQHPPHT
jgi:hypothetical protein